jgi:hypothetical protein
VPPSDHEAKLTSFWLQSGFGPREAAAKLQSAYGGESVSEDTFQELEKKWRSEPNATRVLAMLLSSWNRLEGFDCEDVGWPAGHQDIVSCLAKITGNQFAVDDVVQTVEPNGDLKLSVTHRGNSHSFVMKSYGTWRNVAGTLAGLNRILKQLGVPERFIELYNGGGQGAFVTFVRPDKVLSVARELGIRLDSTPHVE